jgi:hypothetical protein
MRFLGNGKALEPFHAVGGEQAGVRLGPGPIERNLPSAVLTPYYLPLFYQIF